MISRPESVTRDMEQLVANKREHMINYAMARGVKSREDAEDCITEAVRAFFEKYDHTRDLSPITYLYTCSNGWIQSALRSQRTITRSGYSRPRPISLSVEMAALMESDQGGTVAQLESRLAMQAKLKALRQSLDSRTRKVFELMLQGCTNKQVAQQLAMCESRAFQYRKKVRKKALECGVCS